MRVIIITSFLVAFLLTVVAVDPEWRWCRPEFVLLLVIYWSMFFPQNFGLAAAWCTGICLDLLQFSPLGFHAMGLLLISYISLLLYRRIRNYLLWHQALWIFVLVVIFQLFSHWLGNFYGKVVDSSLFLISSLLTALLWPLLVAFMGRVLGYFRVFYWASAGDK